MKAPNTKSSVPRLMNCESSNYIDSILYGEFTGSIPKDETMQTRMKSMETKRAFLRTARIAQYQNQHVKIDIKNSENIVNSKCIKHVKLMGMRGKSKPRATYTLNQDVNGIKPVMMSFDVLFFIIIEI